MPANRFAAWSSSEPVAPTTAVEVLDFWFGNPGSPERGEPRDVWFRKSETFDNAVREHFLPLYEQAAAGALGAWNDAPHALLALIILLDQFPRNMFRNAARAFATDGAALAAATRMVEQGWDVKLAPVARWFAYLPFEHAEDAVMQQRSVQLFASLATGSALADVLVWARKHHDVIARFGRFPHRNAVLGRVSTAAEIEFLKEPGSTF